jgi:hypothetical protein
VLFHLFDQTFRRQRRAGKKAASPVARGRAEE